MFEPLQLEPESPAGQLHRALREFFAQQLAPISALCPPSMDVMWGNYRAIAELFGISLLQAEDKPEDLKRAGGVAYWWPTMWVARLPEQALCFGIDYARNDTSAISFEQGEGGLRPGQFAGLMNFSTFFDLLFRSAGWDQDETATEVAKRLSIPLTQAV